MARPRRLYTDENGKFYYIINKKKVFIKVPKGATMKQVQKVNIKNIVNLPERKRIKRRKKKIKPKFEKPPSKSLYSILTKQTEGELPYYVFREKQEFPTLEDISKGKKTEPFKLEYVKQPQLTLPPPPPEQTPKIITGLLMGEPVETRAEMIPEKPSLDVFGEPITSPVKLSIPKGKIPGESEREISAKSIRKMFDKKEKILSLDEVKKNTRKNVVLSKYYTAVKKYKASLKGDGYGSDSDDDGLYNDEIEKVIKKRVKDYVPVIPADKTDDLLKYVGRGDKRFGAIVNTADSSSDGTGRDGNSMGHWTAVYINNEDDFPSIEYFDPLVQGEIPDRLYNSLRKIARRMNPEMYFKFKPNMIRRQDIKKSSCGWHSMKFLDDRYNGIAFHDASGYDDFIEQNKGADNSLDGEKDIDDYKKKYTNYI
jgi:hypothetical protein